MSEKVYLKVVLLGKVNSGKTCLVTRYITDTFSPEQPSVSLIHVDSVYRLLLPFVCVDNVEITIFMAFI